MSKYMDVESIEIREDTIFDIIKNSNKILSKFSSREELLQLTYFVDELKSEVISTMPNRYSFEAVSLMPINILDQLLVELSILRERLDNTDPLRDRIISLGNLVRTAILNPLGYKASSKASLSSSGVQDFTSSQKSLNNDDIYIHTFYMQIEDRGKKAISELEKSKTTISKELQRRFDNTLENLKNQEYDLQQSLSRHYDHLYNLYNKAHNKALRDTDDKISKTIDSEFVSFTEKVNLELESISKKIEKEVSAFNSKRNDMDKLLEKVGLAKDADVTIEQANKEEEAANKLRKYGLFGLCIAIVLLVLFFAEYIGLNFWSDTSKSLSDLTIPAFAFRFMTVLLVSSPALYLLKESAAHRSKENLYRQRGTQLLTIRGYLADLPDNHRAEVKQSLAENFFSFHNGKTDVSNVPDFLKNMQDAISLARNINGSPESVNSKTDRAEQTSRQ
ncbi:hypothetical protein [Vibrio brasiliensis]|uniref:hypothetical protein n=1 Tax=Vibrio brasiliensis TaxID=170652 RepID=UPI001EFCC9DA|nr:hypothetical protein [Vibrio brasiliensis]MCG9724491.1 hypothetical protein [Vibrio brasiliensis]